MGGTGRLRVDRREPSSGLLHDWWCVGRATLVTHAVGAVTSVLLRSMLSPASMGIWQTVKLLLAYGNYANLGISKGAVRELVVARGSGRMRRAQIGLRLAFTLNTLTSLGYAAVLVAIAAAVAVQSDGPHRWAWSAGLATAGLLAVLSRYFSYHVTILRATEAFRLTSSLAIIESVLTLLVATTAAWWFGLAGLYAGTLLVLAAATVYVVRHRAVDLTYAWHPREMGRLIAIGGPILLAGTVSSLFRSLDKVVILAMFPQRETQLGLYGVSLLASTQLFGLGNMLASVLHPRLGGRYGKTRSRAQTVEEALRAAIQLGNLMTLPAIAAVVLGPPILAYLLPEYRDGLVALPYLVPAALIQVIALPLVQYLNIVDQQRRALIAVLGGTIVALLLNLVLVLAGFGLEGVAAATALGGAIYLVSLEQLCAGGVLPIRQRSRLALFGALVIGVPLAATTAPDWFVSLEPRWLDGAVRLVLAGALWAVAAYYAQGGLVDRKS